MKRGRREQLRHPNGKATLKAFDGVLCNMEGRHWRMCSPGSNLNSFRISTRGPCFQHFLGRSACIHLVPSEMVLQKLLPCSHSVVSSFVLSPLMYRVAFDVPVSVWFMSDSYLAGLQHFLSRWSYLQVRDPVKGAISRLERRLRHLRAVCGLGPGVSDDRSSGF